MPVSSRRPPPPTAPTPIAEVLRCLFSPGDVVELRALGVQRRQERPHSECGFFDDFSKLGELALSLESFAKGVYVTLNPLKKDILARRCNRIDYANEHDTATDKDVLVRRYLLVDADPVRVTGISATDEEKAEASNTIIALGEYLHGEGWPDPIMADSGNGYHLLYRIDLPTDDGGLVKRCLQALGDRFDNDRVKIDREVFNPSRITKLYGSVARKGDPIAERPHRRSALLVVPEGGARPVPPEKLQALAALAPPPPAQSAAHAAYNGNGNGNGNGHQGGDQNRRLNVPKWLAHYGQEFRIKDGLDSVGRVIYVLARCPFDPAHGIDACVMQGPDGKLSAKCFHNGCAGNGWKEFKERIGEPLPEHYDAPGNATINFPPLIVASQLKADDANGSWVWHGFIAARGITLLSALWKVGKTTLLAHLLHRMGTASPPTPPDDRPKGLAAVISHMQSSTLCGHDVTPGVVVYVTEESQDRWAKRRDTLSIGDNVHFMCRPFRGKPSVVAWLDFIYHIRERATKVGAALVMLDTLSSLWCVRNENDACEVQAALMPLWELSECCAVLITHHLKKGDGTEATGSRGSGALMGFVDTIVELRREDPKDEKSRKRVIRAYGRDEETPAEVVIELDPVTNEYLALGDRKGVKIEDLKRKLFELLSTAEPPGMTYDEIKAAWPDEEFPRKGTMTTRLDEGAERGDWTRTGEGKKGSPHRFFVPRAGAD
jgi:hypothetical protein